MHILKTERKMVLCVCACQREQPYKVFIKLEPDWWLSACFPLKPWVYLSGIFSLSFGPSDVKGLKKGSATLKSILRATISRYAQFMMAVAFWVCCIGLNCLETVVWRHMAITLPAEATGWLCGDCHFFKFNKLKGTLITMRFKQKHETCFAAFFKFMNLT